MIVGLVIKGELMSSMPRNDLLSSRWDDFLDLKSPVLSCFDPILLERESKKESYVAHLGAEPFTRD